jgi:hypothetical protein
MLADGAMVGRIPWRIRNPSNVLVVVDAPNRQLGDPLRGQVRDYPFRDR